MKTFIPIILFGFIVAAPASGRADDGVITKQSAHSVAVTLDRLEELLAAKSLTVFVRVDHAAGAQGENISLRPTQLLLFGNPRLGSHLMTSRQQSGLDLPMKALAWEDAKGVVWLSYNDPAYIARRHGISDRAEIINKMATALDNLTGKAVQR